MAVYQSLARLMVAHTLAADAIGTEISHPGRYSRLGWAALTYSSTSHPVLFEGASNDTPAAQLSRQHFLPASRFRHTVLNSQRHPPTESHSPLPHSCSQYNGWYVGPLSNRASSPYALPDQLRSHTYLVAEM